MTLFLILVPFATFGLLMLVTSAAVALFGAAAIGLAVVAQDVARGGSLKLLAAGSVALFVGLGCYVTLVDGHWSAAAIRLAVDGGVLAIALLSLAIRLPFTLQYARERVEPEILHLPHFLRTNYILTWAWTAAFVMMLVADVISIYMPSLPLWVGLGIAFAARNSAAYFTKWYPQYRRAKFAQQSGASTPSAS